MPSPPPCDARAQDSIRSSKVEVEADTLVQMAQAVAAGADIILLDNMPLKVLRAAVKHGGRSGVNGSERRREFENGRRQLRQTGVDYISVGALTHSARAMDIGLDFEKNEFNHG